eukprot:350191_1
MELPLTDIDMSAARRQKTHDPIQKCTRFVILCPNEIGAIDDNGNHKQNEDIFFTFQCAQRSCHQIVSTQLLCAIQHIDIIRTFGFTWQSGGQSNMFVMQLLVETKHYLFKQNMNERETGKSKERGSNSFDIEKTQVEIQ